MRRGRPTPRLGAGACFERARVNFSGGAEHASGAYVTSSRGAVTDHSAFAAPDGAAAAAAPFARVRGPGMRSRHSSSPSPSAGPPSTCAAVTVAACAATAAAASFSATSAAVAAAVAAAAAADASTAAEAGVDVQRTWNRPRGPAGLLLCIAAAWSPPNMRKRSGVAVLDASNGKHGVEYAR